jgi:hypothetical protein
LFFATKNFKRVVSLPMSQVLKKTTQGNRFAQRQLPEFYLYSHTKAQSTRRNTKKLFGLNPRSKALLCGFV